MKEDYQDVFIIYYVIKVIPLISLLYLYLSQLSWGVVFWPEDWQEASS